jgi:hypothetical protein
MHIEGEVFMKKKAFMLIVGLLLLSLAAPLWSGELELGVSLFPIDWGNNPNEGTMITEADESFINSWLFGFHMGYAWGLFYTSWDSFVLPPHIIRDIATVVENDIIVREGFYRPGFVNYFDFGLRLVLLNTLVGFAELGVNTLYIYKQDQLAEEDQPGTFGANLRLGAGLRVNDWLGIDLTGTALFPSFGKMLEVLGDLSSDDDAVQEAALSQIKLFPTVMLVWYL